MFCLFVIIICLFGSKDLLLVISILFWVFSNVIICVLLLFSVVNNVFILFLSLKFRYKIFNRLLFWGFFIGVKNNEEIGLFGKSVEKW